MGKSIKKMPFCTDNNNSHEKRKKASRGTRYKLNKEEEAYNGGSYKKVYQSWNIKDYKFLKTEQEAIEEYNRRIKDPRSLDFINRFPTLESYLNWWRKCYKAK